jgi:hypothetical protein
MRMNRVRNGVITVLAIGVSIVVLSACQKKEGPVERAGKEIDKSIESVGQHLERAGQDIQDAARDAKK